MRISNILHLYRLRLRARLIQETFAVIGIAVGVALLFASQVANTSLSGSVSQLTSGIVGKARFEVTSRGSSGFDQSVLSEVRRIGGVRVAVPVLAVDADLVGAGGQRSVDLIGVQPRFVELRGALLHNFTPQQLAHQRALAIPQPVAEEVGAGPLQTVTVRLGATDTQALIGTTLQAADIGALVHSPVAIAPLSYAQRLSDMPGRITRILVEPQTGRAASVRSALKLVAARAGLAVQPAGFEARMFEQAEEPTTQSTELFSAISALVGFLFAFNALLLTAPQRRALVSDLRLDGYSPWEVTRVLALDTVVLGCVGCVGGLALGDLLSRGIFHANPGYLSIAFPVGSQRIVTWQCVAIAVAGGLLAATVGVLGPSRHVLSGRPSTADESGPTPHRRWAVAAGVVCLAATIVILLTRIATVAVAVIGFACLLAALLVLLPSLLRGMLATCELLLRPLRAGSARIAVIELRSRSAHARSLAIAATGAIAVFGVVSIDGARGDLQRGLNASAHDSAGQAAVWVTAAGSSNLLATTPFANDARTRISRLNGVAGVAIYRGSFLDVGSRRTWVIAPPRDARSIVFADQIQGTTDPALAATRLRAGGWAILSTALAATADLKIGDSFMLPSPRPTRLRVAGLYNNLGWPPGAIVVNAQEFAHAWDTTQPSAYQVSLKQGASAAAVAAEIRAALGPRSGLIAETAAHRERRFDASTGQGLTRLSQIRMLVLVAAILAMAAATGAMLWQRRPHLASMAIDGFSPRELWCALIWESGLLIGGGCCMGAAFGLCGQLLLSHALATVTGFPTIVSIEAPAAAGAFALVAAVAVAIVAVPGYLAARVHPATRA